jgi:hypothetical protein
MWRGFRVMISANTCSGVRLALVKVASQEEAS